MADRFVIVDVFTDVAFGGNQLAVFPDASSISDRDMQAYAREINFAETTFVLPPKKSSSAFRVRIFTPRTELPFAGHPTIGTVAALAHLGWIPVSPTKIVLEEGVGDVTVEIHDGTKDIRLVLNGSVECPTMQPEKAAAAAAISLPSMAVRETWFASAGLPFCFLHLQNKEAVDSATLDRGAWTANFAKAWAPQLFLFSGSLETGGELYARMFAPAFGIEEDPATGSACAALAGYLASFPTERDGNFAWTVMQGIAMGRPSTIQATAERHDGRVTKISVGGSSIIVGEGQMYLRT